MPESHDDLKERLKALCEKHGGVAFGIISAAAVEELPRVKVEWTINRMTVDLSSVLPEAKSVIVFGIPSTDDTYELAVHIEDEDYEYPGYVRLNRIRSELAGLLRDAGYKAAYPYEEDSLTSFKRLAHMAGIGAFGKSSLIISPQHGPWLRFGVIFTDADLEPSGPFGKDLCEDCDRCIRACPTGAISPYVVDPGRCLVGLTREERATDDVKELLRANEPQLTRRTHVMCTRCQMVCPHTSDERRSRAILGKDG